MWMCMRSANIAATNIDKIDCLWLRLVYALCAIVHRTEMIFMCLCMGRGEFVMHLYCVCVDANPQQLGGSIAVVVS